MERDFGKYVLWSLYISMAVLLPVFILLVGSFQPLYYVLWVFGVGGYVYRNRNKLSAKFQSLDYSPFIKFLGLGIAAILLEEMFATLAMHLATYLDVGSFANYGRDVLQFWMVNLLALPGLIIAWYWLSQKYAYTNKEIFILAGLFGLYAEKVYLHIVAYPLIGPWLVVPTFFTYGLLIMIPVLGLRKRSDVQTNRWFRYSLGLVVPVVVSMPFILILAAIYSNAPHLFPPFGFFQ